MRHKRVGRKLGVKSKHRKSMFRNMATELLKHDRIKTSDVRAKEIRRVVEKLITLAKKGTLESRRKAEGYIRDKEVVKKLFTDLAKRFEDRPGGYTRIVKLGFRRGDNSPVSLIELVEEGYKPKKKSTKTTAKKKDSDNTDKQSTKSSKKESAEDLGLVETAAAAKAVESESKQEDAADSNESSESKVEARKTEAEGVEDEVIEKEPESEKAESKNTPVEEETPETNASEEQDPEDKESDKKE